MSYPVRYNVGSVRSVGQQLPHYQGIQMGQYVAVGHLALTSVIRLL